MDCNSLFCRFVGKACHVLAGGESVFAVITGKIIVGFCIFMKTGYYPDNKYFPWISDILIKEL